MLIHESIVATRNDDGTTHLAPMGVWADGDARVLAPFAPSKTLANLRRERCAVINRTDDVRVFAGSLCGRRDWPLCDAERLPMQRLADALSHAEVEVAEIIEDDVRPRFLCTVAHEANHTPFAGFNRAQAAVIELSILVSRLDRLPPDKVEREIEYLKIAIEKTAGEREREAWGWLMDKVRKHRARSGGAGTGAGSGADTGADVGATATRATAQATATATTTARPEPTAATGTRPRE